MVPKKEPSPRGHWELADVFEHAGALYRREHRLPLPHVKVMQAILQCRTKALGGHLDTCNTCDYSRPSYNSCRNRHCPKCQSLAKARWLKAREEELLPVPYFHLVFTLPHELNRWVLYNKRCIYNLLFSSVSQTLLGFAQHARKGFRGQIGFTAILHTWDQKLGTHIHLHCAVPAGALAKKGKHWMAARKNFLFPVKALRKVFRGKFLDGLKKAYEKNQLRLEGFQESNPFSQLLSSLYQKRWVVYAKEAFGGPKGVLDYLGRYTHRIAITNERILDLNEQSVTFSYKDRKQKNQKKAITLENPEFVRRFLNHVLPSGFMRIRHFGLLANKNKKKNLQACRKGLNERPPKPGEKQTTLELLYQLTGRDPSLCPQCKTGHLQRTEILHPQRPWKSPHSFSRMDSS